ncbi:hypothetical protein JW968_00495 [Candidatus Woesearchaeota archaeon]|nr:hypothetical protein [Candidatus Woesearchaeota archaeon]
MVCNITEIVLNQANRTDHIKRMLTLDGLTDERIREHITKYRSMVQERIPDISEEDLETANLYIIDGHNPGFDPCEVQATIDKYKGITSFLDDILQHLGDTGFLEAEDACYSGLALTGVAKDKMPNLLADHERIKAAVVSAGLRRYDPAEAPFNPQHKLVGLPQEVFDIDNLMVAASRFFTFTNLAASSGGGMEERTAIAYNKMPIIIMKKGEYTSRMTTGARRVLLFEYSDIKAQFNELVDFISEARSYSPGIGTCSEHGNTLVGFREGDHLCLPAHMERKFPSVKYDFSQYQK